MVFDFELKEEDMKRIDDLNRNYRVGPDPDAILQSVVADLGTEQGCQQVIISSLK
ncbi:putative oxidoreductase YtbE [compost metagenome]